MEEDRTLSESLQHPRRSLGNRYRSQAEKFLKLGKDTGNLSWAEQSAKQSVLYDFTNEENWRVLIRIKVLMEDSEGSRLVLSDLFSVLGRDPELMSQLSGIDIISSCEDLLEGAFLSDPLDPDKWWSGIFDKPEELQGFAERLRTLDVSDQRSNILYSRRLQKVREGAYSCQGFSYPKDRQIMNRGNNWESCMREGGNTMRHGFAMTKPMPFILDLLQGRGLEKGWRQE